MGRPKLGDRKCVDITLHLRPETIEAITAHAATRGERPGPLMRRVLERVFGHLSPTPTWPVCYTPDRHRPRASTLTMILQPDAESPPDAVPPDLIPLFRTRSPLVAPLAFQRPR